MPTRKKLRKLMLVSLLVISLPMQSNALNLTSLSLEDQQELAAFAEQCTIDKADLSDTKKAYEKCVDRDAAPMGFWQSTAGIVSISALSLLLGVAVGLGGK